MENLYQGDKSKKLDPRGVFIIQAHPNMPVYIWQGGDVPNINLSQYMNEARRYIKLLQKNEKANEKVVTFEQGSEDQQFWSLFFKKQKPANNQLYGNVNEWSKLFIDVSRSLIFSFNTLFYLLQLSENFVKADPVCKQMENYRDIVDEE